MARGAVAASSQRDNQPNSQPHADSKTSKRRCVSSACVPCRKRKSKCDGGTPFCATCTAVYKTGCHYDPDSEGRRLKLGASGSSASGTKRDAPAADGDSASSAYFIVDNLRRLPEEHINEFVQHIRKDASLDTNSLADSWRRNFALPPSTPVEIRSLESDLSAIIGNPTFNSTGEGRHFGHTASLGLVPEDESFGRPRPRLHNALLAQQGTTWSTVTDDLAFVERLLHLYFTWSHPFYVLFSRECFYKDFRSGREKYCSSLLVNAICAYACHLTDEPAGRTDLSNFRTAGDHFFAEARRQLFDDETPTLTTVQALCVMALREPSTGRDSSGFGYIGRCIRMCIELGLHLDNHTTPTLGLTPSEIEVRKVTFWGCFTVDTIYSICTGRITQLPRAAITLDKPILQEPITIPDARVPAGPVTSRMFLQEFATLSELVNDNNYIFFAPKERLTSTRLIDCYKKYQAWYKRLPPSLGVDGKTEPEPHILVLHMLYFTIIVHLFRPMLKMDIIHSDIVPRDICIDAANNVSRLVRIYRLRYDFRVAHLTIPHILLSVCVVHLTFSEESEVAYQNLVEGLQGLEDLHECHYFGARSFRIIYTLAKTWKIPWPEELRHSHLIIKEDLVKIEGTINPPADPLLVAPNTMPIPGSSTASAMPYSPIRQSHRRESLTMFTNGRLQLATHPASSRSISAASGQRVQSPASSHTPTQGTFDNVASISSYSYPQSMNSVLANVTAASAPSSVDTTEGLFWNPIPGVPGPILPRANYQHVSPMGLETVLQNPDMGERLGRDGFRINEDWQSRHVNGYPPNVSNNVYGASNEHAPSRYTHQPNGSYAEQGPRAPYPQATQAQHQDEYDSAGWWQNVNGGPGPIS